jgi:hypothetical protein
VIAALAASGDPMADDILSAWADKRLVIRKVDGMRCLWPSHRMTALP